jgi:hypothetical protein
MTVADIADMVARSGGLKRQLVDYAKQPRFSKAFRRTLAKAGIDEADASMDQVAYITCLDSFILVHRQPDGRTLVDHFLDDRPDLAEADRELVRSWRDTVDGIFEVQRRDGDALILHNVIDELTYRVHSNIGPAVFAHMPAASFVITRLVPVGDEWLLSGAQSTRTASARREVAEVAAEMSISDPELVFRNPEKLKRGWELQHEDRAMFIQYFDSDVVTVPGAQLAGRMDGFWEFRNRAIAERIGVHDDDPPAAPRMETSPELTGAETVGMIYDETEGLVYLAEFGSFAEAFEEPDRVRRQPHRGLVRSYLDDDSVSPLPFRLLAARDPEKASLVFRLLLKRPGFSWESDGETLLRRHKAKYFDAPQFPRVTPVGELALEHYRTQSAQATGAAPRRGEQDRRAVRRRIVSERAARNQEHPWLRSTTTPRPHKGTG